MAAEARKVQVPSTGYYLIDSGEAGPRAPALIGLHGGSQTAADFLRPVRKIAPADFAAVAAQGFNQLWNPPDFNRITFSWLTGYEKEDSIERNNLFLASLIDDLAREGRIDPANVWLIGFSQGSSVAFRFAHRMPERVRGLISVCSDLPPDVEADLAPLAGHRVLILYGLQDKIISPEKGKHAYRALIAGGIDARELPFDRGHLVPSSLAPEIQSWLREAPRPAAALEKTA